MSLDKKIKKIIEANKAYREGTPIISDEEFDCLLSFIENESPEEYEKLRITLFEVAGSIKHNYIIGSLNKIKYGEGLVNFVVKKNIKTLLASEKIDGCSFVARYSNGKYIACHSRGDGIQGTDWTEKGRHILKQKIDATGEVEIRGEFTLTGNSHIVLGLKNRRNGTVGIMNQKDIDTVKLSQVEPIVYQILNSKLGISDQFLQLYVWGFITPRITKVMLPYSGNLDDLLKNFLLECKATSNYDIDGLVISDISCKNEDLYLPENKIAYKVNSEGIETEVLDIEWTMSKNKLMKPVFVLKPVEIDGTTVSRASGYNAKWVLDSGINIGKKVLIIKSGSIIPKIIGVID